MGLAASQVRLLQLTSRQHRIEYQAQKIQAQKLQLSNESDMVYNNYMRALDAKKVQYKFIEKDGTISYKDATFNTMFGGYADDTHDGVQNLYALKNLKEDTLVVSSSVKTAWDANKASRDNFATACAGVNADPAKLEYYQNLYDLLKANNGKIEEMRTNYIDSNEWLTNVLANGNYIIQKWEPEGGENREGEWIESSVATDTLLQEVADEKELKKAEATYEAETSRINKKDAQYDTLLSQTETERNAIKTEMDSLKQVRNENIEKAFKLFS